MFFWEVVPLQKSHLIKIFRVISLQILVSLLTLDCLVLHLKDGCKTFLPQQLKSLALVLLGCAFFFCDHIGFFLKKKTLKKKKNFKEKTLWPLFMDGVQLPKG